MTKKGRGTKTKVGIKKPEPTKLGGEVHMPPGKPPKRIRMLIDCANKMSYMVGHSYRVPQEVPVDTARSWIASGAAEEDKSLAGVPKEKK